MLFQDDINEPQRIEALKTGATKVVEINVTLQKRLGDALTEAVKYTKDLEAAYKGLGITSQEQLEYLSQKLAEFAATWNLR